MVKVFVAGATGVLGRRAVARLVAAGHEVKAVARTPDKARWVERQGGRPVTADLLDPEEVAAAVAGADAVANLATRIPPTSRMALASAWKENDRLRREASANLVAAGLAGGAGVCVQESVGFFYADGGDAWLDERAPVEPSWATASALAAEAQAERVTAAGGRGVVLRFAQLVAPDSGHMRDLARLAARGWLPLVGRPDGHATFVHADDAAAAVVAALGASAGVYNVAEDEPITRADHAAAWSRLLSRQVRLPPAWVGRLPRLRLQARSQRMSNARLREATGWRPSYPTMRDAWPEIAATLGTETDREVRG